jgi:hypothetical protein
MIEKLIVSPQIVVYKNIFKSSKPMVNFLNSKNKEIIDAEWQDWYDNGWRFSLNFDEIKKSDSLEYMYLKEMCDAFDYISKDYMECYSKENGIWPSFIKDWDSINLNNHNLDFFKYNLDQSKDRNWDSDFLMNYHVDEFDVDGSFKSQKNIVTVNFYLNDDYEGGEICAYNKDLNVSYRYKPVAGDAVVMPSSSPFFHAVKPFYLSDRYFSRIFINYNDASLDGSQVDNFFSKEHFVGNQYEKKFIDEGFQFLNVDIKEIEVGETA